MFSKLYSGIWFSVDMVYVYGFLMCEPSDEAKVIIFPADAKKVYIIKYTHILKNLR